MATIAESIIKALADHGVSQMWGVVGDALNPITDALRRDGRIEWIGVRHEEAGAFAVSAQAQLTGRIGVCMGTVGPGSVHLLNGLYDAAKSHAPVLALAGQVPSPEIGSNFFQEVDNHRLFDDVAVFNETVTSAEQMPLLLEQAVNAAYARQGVAVLTLPGDLGELELPKEAREPAFVSGPHWGVPPLKRIDEAAAALADDSPVTLLVGMGAREAREEILQLAETLGAPMVLTLKGKEGLEHDNRFQVGQSGLIGNSAAAHAMDNCHTLVMVGTDFPYRDWYPSGKTVIQIDCRQEHIGRRTAVTHALVGDAKATVKALIERIKPRSDTSHLDKARDEYLSWSRRQQKLANPDLEKHSVVGKIRDIFENPDDRIRPEILAGTINEHASKNAIFTSDTGMSTAWLARYVDFGLDRRLIGSYNLGSMANAMPHALGAQALDRDRQVISFSGDGGLMMLLGDLRTAVTFNLPVKVIVFNNGRLGMVKLEQEQGGLPEFGTELDNPDIAAVATALGLSARRITDPDSVADGVQWALEQDGPTLLDVVTNPDEISLPPKPTVAQGWGFAIAKVTEAIESA